MVNISLFCPGDTCLSPTRLMLIPTAEIDKTRSTSKKQPLGGSIFGDRSSSSMPSELQPLLPLQTAVTKTAMASGSSANNAETEYTKLQDPNAPRPPPPVHAARLSQLLKTLANAESSVSEVIKSRRALIDGLEKILENNRSELTREETLLSRFGEQKTEIDAKKHEVEDAIVRGLADEQESEIPRPEVEALTPPPVEAITPIGSPKPEEQQHASHGPFSEGPPVAVPQSLVVPGFAQDQGADVPSDISPVGGNDFDFGTNGAGAKRRKLSHGEEDYAQYATGDLDADVADMIAEEGKQLQ